MSQSHRKITERSAGREFLAFENASVRSGEAALFRNTNWTWRAGEQWAILGLDASGKSLLVEAISGRAPLVRGEVRGPSLGPGIEDSVTASAIAHVSPRTQRDLAMQASPFYQMRWHGGLDQGSQTVAGFLSQENVEDHNPFAVNPRRGNRREFIRFRRQFVDWLGLKALLRRRLVHLSNGEMRKTLLAHALLKSPRLLVLEDPYAGLDAATRRKLGRVVARLMRTGRAVLVVTDRADEIPAGCTHLLLINKHKIVAQGPKPEMLPIWHERFHAPPCQSGGLAVSAPAKRNPRKEPPPGRPLLEFCHVTVKGARRTILRDIVWTMRPGECWALLGPNGAGKTTLLNLIQGDHPQAYSQEIRLFGRRTDSTQALWQARQCMGWMSPELHQHYPAGWEAVEVVCSGFFNSVGLHQPCSQGQRAAARQWLRALGVGGQAAAEFGELPFGQQRLVLLARAVVKQPRLLILDEPCQGLDAAQRRTLLGAVDRVVAETATGLIFVTHHQDELPHCITHLLRLSGGRVRDARPVRYRDDSLSSSHIAIPDLSGAPGRTPTCIADVRSVAL